MGARAPSSFTDRNAPNADAGGTQLEDPADHGGFLGRDLALDVLAPSVTADDLAVPIAEHDAASDLAGARLPRQSVVGALSRLLPFQLVGKGRHAHEQLVGGGVERALAVFEVEPHPDAGLGELLERVGDLDLLAPEP